MLHEEVEKYINLSGDKEAWQNTSVSRIGGYLDGYDKGLEVLDKIRAEVENINVWGMRYNPDKDKDRKPQIVQKVKEHVIKILDKYKAESEG
jgi:hypothetical protein